MEKGLNCVSLWEINRITMQYVNNLEKFERKKIVLIKEVQNQVIYGNIKIRI